MRFLIAILCLWLLPGAVYGLYHGIAVVIDVEGLAKHLLLGFLAGLILCPIARAIIPGFGVFRHGLVHAVVATLTLDRIEELMVSRSVRARRRPRQRTQATRRSADR